MHKTIYSLILILGLGFISCRSMESQQTPTGAAQETSIHDFNQILTPELLREHLFVVASDSFEGRGTGQPGMEKAAKYITDYYRANGVKGGMPDGGFFQDFNLRGQVNTAITTQLMQVNGTDTTTVYTGTFSRESMSGFFPMFGGEVDATAPVVFVGYGVNDASKGVGHLDGVDIRDKWLLLFETIQHVVNGDTLVSASASERQRLNELIFRGGAAGVLMISDFNDADYMVEAQTAASVFGNPGRLSLEYTNPRGGLRASVFSVSPANAARLLGVSTNEIQSVYANLSANPAAFSPRELNYIFKATPNIETIQVPTQNIIAVVEGSDPLLKDEYVIVTAHYDHTGIGAPDATGDRIYNGADDDGSGTVAIMTMAHAMTQAKLAGKGPRRSVMFLHVSAEEIGLLGSRYYSDHPTVPVEKIVANLNVDMIGRTDKEHDAIGETDYVYIIGAEIISSDLNRSLQRANEINGNQIRFDMKYNDLTDPNQFYRRSDHWNFGRLGIPFAFYFTGVHDDYHRPSDTPDKILYDKYAKITRQIFSTAAEIANDDKRPVVDSQEFINITQSQAR
jgi:hypothetical protein